MQNELTWVPANLSLGPLGEMTVKNDREREREREAFLETVMKILPVATACWQKSCANNVVISISILIILPR